jgi:hypothetical protein
MLRIGRDVLTRVLVDRSVAPTRLWQGSAICGAHGATSAGHQSMPTFSIPQTTTHAGQSTADAMSNFACADPERGSAKQRFLSPGGT